MVTRSCPDLTCSNSQVGFDIDEENVYCPKCGKKLVDFEGPEQEA